MQTSHRINWYQARKDEEKVKLAAMEDQYEKKVKHIAEMENERKSRLDEKMRQTASPARTRASSQASTANTGNIWLNVAKGIPSSDQDDQVHPQSRLNVPSSSSALNNPARESSPSLSVPRPHSTERKRSNSRRQSIGSSGSISPGKRRGQSPSRSSIQAGTVRKIHASFSPKLSTTPEHTPNKPNYSTHRSTTRHATSNNSYSRQTSTTSRSTTLSTSTSTTSTTSYNSQKQSSNQNHGNVGKSNHSTRIPRSPSNISPAISAIANTFSNPNLNNNNTSSRSIGTSGRSGPSTPTKPTNNSNMSSTTSSNHHHRHHNHHHTEHNNYSSNNSSSSNNNSISQSIHNKPTIDPSPTKPTYASTLKSGLPKSSVPSTASSTASSHTSNKSSTNSTLSTKTIPSSRSTSSSSPTNRNTSTNSSSGQYSNKNVSSSSNQSSIRSRTASQSTRHSRNTSGGSTSNHTSSSAATTTRTATHHANNTSSSSTHAASTRTTAEKPRVSAPKAVAPSNTTRSSSTSPSLTQNPPSVIVEDKTHMHEADHIQLANPIIRGTKLEMRGQILVHSQHDEVIVWDVEAQEVLCVFAKHTAPVHTVTLRNDSHVLSASSEEVLLWSYKSGEVLHSFEGCLAMNAHSSLNKVALSFTSKISILQLPDLKDMFTIETKLENPVTSLAWVSANHLLLTTRSSVHLLNVRSKAFEVMPTVSSLILHMEVYCPNSSGKKITSGSTCFLVCEKEVTCFDLETLSSKTKSTQLNSADSTLFLLAQSPPKSLKEKVLPLFVDPEGVMIISAPGSVIKRAAGNALDELIAHEHSDCIILL